MKRLPALLLLLCAAFSAQAQRLRFAVVTDTHIGREHAAENLKAAIRSIDADDSVRFVLLLGDISHDGTPKGHRKARRLLARLRNPLYLTTGNHDAKRPERYSSFLRTFGTDRFCFDCEGVRFIGITTGPFEPNRHAARRGGPVAGRTMRHPAADGRRRPPHAGPDRRRQRRFRRLRHLSDRALAGRPPARQ